MGKKSAPAAPDYFKLAEQQATNENEQNTKDTWNNRITQNNPYGSVGYVANKTIDPATGKEVTQWTQNTVMNPRLERSLYDQFAVTQGRSSLARDLMGGVRDSMGKPMDYSGFQDWGAAPQAGNLRPTTGANDYAGLIRQAGKGVQGNLNFSGLNPVDDAAATRKRAEDAIYKQAASRLDPQWQQRQSDFETSLANRGMTMGSEGYTKALDDFSRGRNDAYNQAQMSAITGGGVEAERDFGMDMGLRRQQADELMTQGQFRNDAQGQRWGQRFDAGQFGLGVKDQAFDQRKAAGDQNFNQDLLSSTFNNQLRGQQIQEAMQKRGFGLQEINDLLSGAQVGGPNFASYGQAGAGSSADLVGAGQNSYGAAMDAANAKEAGKQNTVNAGIGIASIAAMVMV